MIWLLKGVKGAEKEKIRQAEEEFFAKYADQLALFRRNFFASPFEKLFKKASKGINYCLIILEKYISDNN